jgi:S-adenosylmethionine-diacylglycerol 3-amino-3-carboxypropyl transferase
MAITLKFAVVREDPQIEAQVCERLAARAALVVASGGCTLLELKRRFADLELCGFDFNPLQLEHVRRKMEGAGLRSSSDFNVADDRIDGLNQCGDFEKLFRLLRHYLEAFVCSEEAFGCFFDPETDRDTRMALAHSWFASRYWPAAFHAAFNGPLLNAMFGPAATQHAPQGSYPPYFQAVFEKGLLREDAANNPFLQHILLGCYLKGDAPAYVFESSRGSIELVHGTLLEVPDLSRFDVISLSNIFDWSDDAVVETWAARLKEEVRRGAAIVIRQLNNERDLRRFFEPEFAFDDAWGEALLEDDRSLFYNRIEVGVRREVSS